MKKLLFLAAAACSFQWAQAQVKNFSLHVVAEGNYGTPNGDVYKVSKTGSSFMATEGPLYQIANATVGIDVLQDFEIFGDKAILCGKGAATTKMAITTFPGFDTIATFNNATFGAGIQCLGKASNTKAYVSKATGANPFSMVDLTNNTIVPVTDPTSALSSYASYMVPANGYMYIAIGSKIVKVDTATNSVTGTIMPGLGSIAGMEYDSVRNCIWLLGKVANVSTIVKMEPASNDLLNTPITLTGVTNAKLLRYGANKLYFVSGTSIHAYSITSPVLPTTAVYTTTLPGNSFSIFYGKAFGVDPVSGDFAIAAVGNYAVPSMYEIVDGTTYQRIDSGSVEGHIANELILHTWIYTPSWDTTALAHVYAACDTTLTAPTATFDLNTITGTTNDPVSYNTPGTYTVTWTYTSGNNSISQQQQVTIQDTIAPVAVADTLPNLEGNCPYVLVAPEATDNCGGTITATTDSLTYTQAGNYVITWTYTDASGNSSTQTQQLHVICGGGTGVRDAVLAAALIYPNPANDALHISLNQNGGTYSINLTDMIGKQWLSQTAHGSEITLPVAQLPQGVYVLHISKKGSTEILTQKIIISRK